MDHENPAPVDQSKFARPKKGEGMEKEDAPMIALEQDEDVTPTAQKPTSSKHASAISSTSPQPSQLRRKASLIMHKSFVHAMKHPEDMLGMTKPPLHEFDRLYFFYGSLMDSKNLASVLGLTEVPQLREARVEGYRTMLWNHYPALVRADDVMVNGMAYQIKTLAEVEGQVTRLQRYEGENYDRRMVRIEFKDGTVCSGWTFVWQGDEKELREGTWRLQINCFTKSRFGNGPNGL